MPRTDWLVLPLIFACAWLGPHAQASEKGDMQQLYQSMRPRMVQSPFHRALAMDSTETDQRINGDIYAVLDVALTRLEIVNRDPVRWCEVLLLISNTKNCAVVDAQGTPSLRLRMGTKGPQELGSTTPMNFRFASSVAQAAVLETLLNSDTGPMGTKDGTLRLRAIALGPGTSFIHLHYSYSSSLAGRFATEVYLQTLGRGKVGFSKEAPAPANASPPTTGAFVGGVRGIVERNTMRYFLGLSCALQFASTDTPAQRFAQMAPCWYDETERYPLQLHEMPRQDYLNMKQSEHSREAPRP